jgi:hypothetical protein
MLRRNLLFLLVFAISAANAQTGLIRGTLLDGGGNPVAKADVYAMYFLHCDVRDERTKSKIESGEPGGCDLAKWDGRVDATTDEVGGFVLQRLKWGVYELAAQKPEDGLRSTYRNVFMGAPPVRVVLSATSPSTEVILHFPPKCALLTGTVKNAKTGEMLSGVELRMRPTQDYGYHDYYETSGAAVPMHLLIPSEREFTLEIVANGFESWIYRGESGESFASDAPAERLNLQPGEELHLDIALTPKDNMPQ